MLGQDALSAAALQLTEAASGAGGASPPPVSGGKRCCVRLASTSAAADEVVGKRCAGGLVVPACMADEAAKCELCGEAMERQDDLLFGMHGEWSCAACEEARVSQLMLRRWLRM